MICAVTAKPNLVLSDEKKWQLYSILGLFDKILVSEDMGGSYFASDVELQSSSIISVGRIKEKIYPLRFDEFVKKVEKEGAEVVVTVGGDGIASYVATAIIRQGAAMGILGFPAGTANVGPIVRSDIEKTSIERSARLDSIEVSCAGKVLGYGFNDVIIGHSFLGTVGGRWANLCAKTMALRGEVNELDMKDEQVTGNGFSIRLNGKAQPIPSIGTVKQICVSTVHTENLYGRAIVGGLMEASGMNHPASIVLLDKVANDARPETWQQKAFRTSAHLCFEAGDVIEIGGMSDGVCVIIDGNPFAMGENKLELRCVPDSVLVFGIGR
ncbi:MAG: NAD(+)/NADH kinase [Spirochaetales bacterium]|nr:NAD(+)/NADH kinase [Spirochaetales bacterium]